MSKKKFSVSNGQFYSLLETKDYGEVVFGCPPGIVKEFIKLKKPLPSKFLIPSQTFYDNTNNFDFEFVVYSFLFTRASGSTVTAYCLPEQEKRFRDILNETLFGPRFDQLLESQSSKLLNEKCLNNKDKEKLVRFLKKDLSKNKDIYDLFCNLLETKKSKSQVSKVVRQFFENKIFPYDPFFLNSSIKSLSKKLSKIYLQCAQLQREFDLFSLAKERDRNKFISKTVHFKYPEKAGFFILDGLKNKRKKLKLEEVESGIFKIIESKVERCVINLNPTASVIKKPNRKALQIPSFGVSFVGVGSGFSPDKQNSSTIIWSEGKGILIDVVADNNSILSSYGINKNAINHVFLTHVHSDHDAGAIENLLEKKKTYLITSRIIYDSFLRKAQSLTSLSKSFIEKFVKFLEVEPYKKIKIPGFKNTFFEFDYSLHSIPTGRCKISYAKGKTKKIISHSGDTKYDLPKINEWHEKGFFTKIRKNEIIGFIWESDLIIHDVGGGILHTSYDSLLHLDKKIKKKIILVHQNDKPRPKSQLRYAKDGETLIVIK
jgi:hypothetical protein